MLQLLACSQVADISQPPPVIEETEVAPVLLNRSKRTPSDERMLDVAVLRFAIDEGEQGSPDAIGAWVFKDILDIESQYLPTVLRKTLMDSNHWGAVRVLPKPDLSMDLSIQGTIIQSDGVVLELHVLAVDSTGREWLNKRYTKTNLADLTGGGKKGQGYSAVSQDPFQSLYNRIANDLLEQQQSLSDRQLQTIRRVSKIKHASDLSPETFSGLLVSGEDGLLTVARLLADNDPMLARVERMQFRHNIFIDTLDDYYLDLNRDMQPVYDLWRYYSREQILEVETELRKDRGKARKTSGFDAIASNYYRYKANKLFEQEWTELAQGFTTELEPTILELNDQVYGLTGFGRRPVRPMAGNTQAVLFI